MSSRTAIAAAVVVAASALLLFGYRIAQEVPMFPWTTRTAPAPQSRPLPPIDRAVPPVVETATFATG